MELHLGAPILFTLSPENITWMDICTILNGVQERDLLELIGRRKNLFFDFLKPIKHPNSLYILFIYFISYI